jgi:hypothetical protein
MSDGHECTFISLRRIRNVANQSFWRLFTVEERARRNKAISE